MNKVGFTTGLSSPCLFYHKGKDIRAVVYGDDFTLLGDEISLDWFRAEIKKEYACDMKARLGPDSGDDKSVRLLNRIVEWNNEGITIEGDQRHAEIIVQQLGIQNERILSSPGERINPKEMTEEDHEELGAADAKVYRAASARANYMAIDRSDIRLAVKELTRHCLLYTSDAADE